MKLGLTGDVISKAVLPLEMAFGWSATSP